MLTKEKKKELEGKFLAALKKSLSPPKSTHKLSSQFISWCKKNKLDPKSQTMDGRNFKKFLAEKKSICRQTMRRAKSLVSLFKFESPLPIGSESAYDNFSDQGWNDCFMAAIRSGKVPIKAENKEGVQAIKWAMNDGWNAAVEKLSKYLDMFK